VKKLLAPLTITLGLMLALGAAASLRSGPPEPGTPLQLASPASQTKISDAVVPVAPPEETVGTATSGSSAFDTTAPPAESETASPDGPVVKTGCGKPTPCPNRSCEDCPFNRYLK